MFKSCWLLPLAGSFIGPFLHFIAKNGDVLDDSVTRVIWASMLRCGITFT